MKKKLLFIITFFTCVLTSQNNLVNPPTINKNVELLSIAFRLAEAQEYNKNIFETYVDKINLHFGEFKDNDLIKYIKKIRINNAIGYDAVMFMAVYLDEDLNPKTEFNENIPEKRWGLETSFEFIRLLKSFYEDTNASMFFNNNEEFYQECISRFDKVYKKFNVNWYADFFGQTPNENFNIILGLGNGGSSYGPSVDIANKKKEVYSILGTWKIDNEGMPIFLEEDYLNVLVHEFNHSFINSMVDFMYPEIRMSCKVIFNEVKQKMEKQAYGSAKTYAYEQFVRAAEIKYFIDNNYDKDFISKHLITQKNRGFILTEIILNSLIAYDENRELYENLKSYLPKLIEVFNASANNSQMIFDEFNLQKPKILKIKELKNNQNKISSNVKSITIIFDRDIQKNNFYVYKSKKYDMPKVTKISLSDDKRECTLDVELEPSKQYEINLWPYSFLSFDGVAIDDYKIKFKTTKL